MASKEVKELIWKLEEQGWRVEPGKKGHFMAYPPDKAFKPISIPGTPSDHRSLKNLVSYLRRAGADL